MSLALFGYKLTGTTGKEAAMRIVVIRSPKLLAAILSKIFGINREEK
ncbi:MAG: stage V sporulation protein SpoVM [Clostridia bacterium]|nr:stage V sporulation protein SpoVM [Clostridia bacterium]